ncbi:hypothetical protein [Segatella copri]|uniref:hypothetical protein n=1 Tax=Segatella copri TaxID=165179 RepID=UPI00294AD860|nr:hypothetical protein [Segatella copri]
MNKLKALLGFDPKTAAVKTELIAGMTTFLTMCYILAAGFGCFCSSIMFSVN